MILTHFQGKPFNVTVIQVYAPTTNAKEAEVELFCEDLQDLLELTLKKKKSRLHCRGLECSCRKPRDTWSNRQVGLGIQNEAGQRPIEFCQENTLVIANTLFQQHKRWLYTWTSPDGQYWNWLYSLIDYILWFFLLYWLYSLHPKMEKLYIVSNNKTGSWLWLRSWTRYCQIQT